MKHNYQGRGWMKSYLESGMMMSCQGRDTMMSFFEKNTITKSSWREDTRNKSQKRESKNTSRTAARKPNKIEEFHKRAEGSKSKAESDTTKTPWNPDTSANSNSKSSEQEKNCIAARALCDPRNTRSSWSGQGTKSKSEEAGWQAPTPKESIGDQYFYHIFINKTPLILLQVIIIF